MNTHRLQSRRIVFGGYGGAVAAAVLGLAVAACTRSMSLGSAGTPDGGDVRASTDAGDAPVDLPADSAPDVATDAPADRNTDATTVTCIDNGVTYHVGDAIPRGTGACPMSCLCLASGAIGNCTGVSRADASTDDAGQNCVDNGITYRSGDVVLIPGCYKSCICIDGTVGACTGACPPDGGPTIRSRAGCEHRPERVDELAARSPWGSPTWGRPPARHPRDRRPCCLATSCPAHPR